MQKAGRLLHLDFSLAALLRIDHAPEDVDFDLIARTIFRAAIKVDGTERTFVIQRPVWVNLSSRPFACICAKRIAATMTSHLQLVRAPSNFPLAYKVSEMAFPLLPVLILTLTLSFELYKISVSASSLRNFACTEVEHDPEILPSFHRVSTCRPGTS